MIAVQIANGTFVPVLDTSGKKRRRLVVTTVRDSQTDVKIELYRGSDTTMADARHVGSLLIENIEPAESGTPDISVLLGVDETGNLNATATDTKSGEYQSLSVNLDQLDQLDREGGYDVPDFQLSDEELTMEDLNMEEGPGDELETFSFDELDSAAVEGSDEEPDTLVDLADEEFSFDDSFGEEILEESDQVEAAEQPAELPAEQPEEDVSFETDLDDGIVEADLGDEDFTFDEGGEFQEPPVPEETRDDDEEDPLFGAPEASGDELDDTLTPEEFDRLDSEPVRAAAARGSESPEEKVEPRRSNAIVFIGYLILALAAIGVLTYLVFRILEGPPAPPLRAGGLGEVSVALLLLSIPARRISNRLGHRRTHRRNLRTQR